MSSSGRPRQRSTRWSLRQVSLEARVPVATARAAVRDGHLDPDRLTVDDVLVLRVASMLPNLRPLGVTRPANTRRVVPAWERRALAVLRDGLTAGLAPRSALFVWAGGVGLGTVGPLELTEPYLVLPVGQWAAELAHLSPAGHAAAA